MEWSFIQGRASFLNKAILYQHRLCHTTPVKNVVTHMHVNHSIRRSGEVFLGPNACNNTPNRLQHTTSS